MRAVAAEEMIVSGHGLREGLALDALGESVAPPNVVRQMSLAGLAARFSTWRSDVAARRTRLALLLLDSLDSKAGAPAREVLASAATILDIGQSVDYYNRYVHAARMLLEADLSGFSHRDTALLAATVSFAESEGSMRVYEPLIGPKDQRLVRRLAAILFAADHLQRLLSGKDDPHVERRGRKLSIGACVLDRGPLVEPVRRLGEAFGVDAQLVVDVRAA
jgi:exopolyphosphatase/pppGpp-phosphohydrolase